MSPFRYRDDDSSSGTTIASVLIGAVAGFAVGMYVAQRVGGLTGLKAGLKRSLRRERGERGEEGEEGERDVDDRTARRPFERTDEFGDVDTADDAETSAELADTDDTNDELDEDFNGMDATDDTTVPLLEERVLEAFNNDPILAERAIDIGAMGGEGIIELAGWVDSDDEAEHAMTVARGVPGVDTVVNRLVIDNEEEQIGTNIKRFREGDPSLSGARWEGQQVGTGKRRQGMSDEVDRHADPKPVLEEKWLSPREAVRNSADDLAEIRAERRKGRGKKADEAEPQS